MQYPCRGLNLDDAPIFVLGIDLDSKIIVWNNYAAQITGFSGERALGMSLLSCFETINKRNCVHHRGRANFLRKSLNHWMKKRRLIDAFVRIHSTDDKSALMKICLRPWTQSGDLIGLISIGHNDFSVADTMMTQDVLNFIDVFNDPAKAVTGDVSSCYQFREALDSASVEPISNIPRKDVAFLGLYLREPRAPDPKHNFQHLIDNMDSIIFGLDHSGNVNLWNSKSAEIFGIAREKILGKNFVQVFIVYTLAPLRVFYEY